MKYLILIAALSFLLTSTISAQEERKVLVEVFTNSHCPLCPPAHNAVENYLSGPNGNKISYIFYHMVYPYSDDSLYYQSMEGSDARDNYYNPVHGTPQGWFDGIHQAGPSGWDAALDSLVAIRSPLKIVLSGTRNSTQFNINAELTRTGNINDSDLVIHFVVAEDLYYAGRNGTKNHIHVMRKMLPTPDGQPFTIHLNETKNISQVINLEPLWDADSLSIIVFVQSSKSETVYQSETINNDELVITGVDAVEKIPSYFVLRQNYPNPFNPTTCIQYSIGSKQFVSLKIYDALGREVKTLLNENKNPGKYKVTFDGSNLPSGVYFYSLKTENFYQVKKMLLIK